MTSGVPHGSACSEVSRIQNNDGERTFKQYKINRIKTLIKATVKLQLSNKAANKC